MNLLARCSAPIARYAAFSAKRKMVFLFGERGRQVGSVAAVPLRYDSLYGILAVGNSDPNFYKSSMGTLFLSYIAEILNRLMPGHLKALV